MSFKKWIVSLIVLLLIGGIGFAAFNFVKKKLAEPRGMYVECNGKVYEADDAGIAVSFRRVAAFTVKHADGWGLYDASDCKVKIYANTAESCNFSYTVDGAETPLYFSLLSDVSSAFVKEPSTYQGKGLSVNANGVFELYLSDFFTMQTVLSRLYEGKEITLGEDVDISSLPYFILEVTSPDGAEVIKLPFTLHELFGEVTGVEMDTPQVVF